MVFVLFLVPMMFIRTQIPLICSCSWMNLKLGFLEFWHQDFVIPDLLLNLPLFDLLFVLILVLDLLTYDVGFSARTLIFDS